MFPSDTAVGMISEEIHENLLESKNDRISYVNEFYVRTLAAFKLDKNPRKLFP